MIFIITITFREILDEDHARTCSHGDAPVIVTRTVQEILDEHIAKKLG
jgi:hypothetical protein